MIPRRTFTYIAAGGLLGAVLPVSAQQADKVWRVGILKAFPRPPDGSVDASLRKAIEEVGFIEGKNIVFESRWGEAHYERLPALAAELVALLEAWLRERRGQPDDPAFPSQRGAALSRDALEKLLTKYATAAATKCPSLRSKRVSPHVLRHTAAMELLRHGVDRTVIALWLGHESVETTHVYLHADLNLKEKALAKTTALGLKPGRFRADDDLVAFLEAL